MHRTHLYRNLYGRTEEGTPTDESMQAYRETANNYRDWTGDYGFGFNRGE